VAGGGRYDGLAGRFTETPIPATGASVGLDRFISALRKLGKITDGGSITSVLVVSIPGTPQTELLKLASELRGAGISTEIFFGQAGVKAGVKDQLSGANARGIPVAILMGEDELKAGTVSVKDLGAGKSARSEITDKDEYRKAGKMGQVTVARAEVVATVRGILGT
jgi:histidyl-tRNA synthetase